MIGGASVSTVTVVAIFLSNLPEGLSSAGMKRDGRSTWYIFTLWGSIAVTSAIAALVGYTMFSRFPPRVIAITTAITAGAVLSMLADTMIPEAYEKVHNFTGFIMVTGFMTAFLLSRMEGA
jgi:ZIP family zinc transporter